ncbi:hypothetical protein ACLQ2N_32485 [Streptomyces sp. DT224]|uniref:hypothetical protein n=1 Tax=Streptomyces sp. DT224 TaxID=3393426 RepID=UPI003CF90F1F
MPEGLQAGRLEVTVVAALDGFAAALRTKVEAAAEGLAVKVKVKVDDKGLRKRLEKAVKKASKGVEAKVRIKVAEEKTRLREEISSLTQAAADDVAVNLPVRVGDPDDRGRQGGLLRRIRGSLRRLVTRAARDPDTTVQVPVRIPRTAEGTLRSQVGRIVRVARRQMRTVWGDAMTPTRGALSRLVRELGRITATAGRETGSAFNRAFWTTLGRQGTRVRSLATTVRVRVASGTDAVRSFAQELRHFVGVHSRDVAARVRIAALWRPDWKDIGRNLRRLGEEMSDALALALGGRTGGEGWIETLLGGPLRRVRVQVRAGVDMSVSAVRDFGRGLQSLARTQRDRVVIGVRLAVSSTRSALAGVARSVRSAGSITAPLIARVRVATEPVRTAVRGLTRDMRRIIGDATRDTRAAVRVAVRPATDAARTLTRGVSTIVRRAGRAALRIRVSPDTTEGPGRFRTAVRRLLRIGQGEADRTPLNVPVRLGMPNRRRMRGLLLAALIPAIQPILGALTQYAFGLTALVSAAAPAVGVLEAIPGLIVAAGTAAIAGVLAFKGFGTALSAMAEAQKKAAAGTKLTKSEQRELNAALKELTPSARASAKELLGLQGAWKKVRSGAQESFFSKIKGQIKPTAETFLPKFSSAMNDAAGQLGNLVARGARAMRSGVFAKGFKQVAGTASTVIGQLSNSTANLAGATGHFLVASGPFVERVGAATERFTRWLRASSQAGRETGSLAKFLDHAGDKAAQLGRATGSLGKGLAGVGRAAMDTGNLLLDSFEGTMTRFARWANSDKGTFSMKRYFNDSASTFHELNRLVGDLMRGLGRMSRDSGITDLVRQIRVELMPGIGRFLDTLGRNMGPTVVALISNIATAIAHLSAAGTGLGFLLASFNGLLDLFNRLMVVTPGLGKALGIMLGTLLALRVVRGVTTMLGGLLSSIRNVGAASSVANRGMGPQISMWQRMGVAYRGAAADAGRIPRALAGASASMGVMRRSAGGLLGALGGPWGAVITGAVIGLGYLATQQEKSARAAQAHKERIDSLSQALRDSNGVIDANVRAQAAQMLQDMELSDGKGKLMDVLGKAHISLGQVTDAYLNQGGSLKGLNSTLQDTIDANWMINRSSGAIVLNDTGLAADRAQKALTEVNGELEGSQKKNKELAEAQKGAGKAGTDSYSRLQAAVEGLSKSTGTADDRVNSLKQALDALTGNTTSFHDAQTRVNEAILSVNDAIDENKKKLSHAAKTLIQADGTIKTTTKTGQAYNSSLKDLRDSALDAAVAALDMAEANGKPLTEGLKNGQAEMAKARDAAVRYGVDLGLTTKEAEGLASQMGLMPEAVTMLLKARGVTEVNAELIGLSVRLANLKKGTSVEIAAPSREAQKALEGFGYKLAKIPHSKNVKITAPTTEASENIKALVADIADAPDSKTITVSAIVLKANMELDNLRTKVASLKGRKLKIDTPTKTAQEALKDLGFKIRDLPGKRVEITVPTSNATKNARAIQGAIDNIRGRSVGVGVYLKATSSDLDGNGVPDLIQARANGAVVDYFANGGITKAIGKIQAFARGGLRSENHVAQIAPAGSYRVWAERETGGEGYIPLGVSKRARSKAIVEEIVRRFGGAVAWYASGGLTSQRQDAVALNRSATTRTTRATPAVPPGNSALVGGDLNLNIAAVRDTREALQDAMFELRRLKLGGK